MEIIDSAPISKYSKEHQKIYEEWFSFADSGSSVYMYLYLYIPLYLNLWGLLKPNSIWVFVWFNHWVIISILHLIIVEMSRDVVKYTVWEPRKNT